MCNLYSMTRNQEAIRRFFAVERDRTGNLPSLPAIFPDRLAPIVRVGRDGARELVMARWGMPTPPAFVKPGAIDHGVTNIRNVASPHWRRWLKPEFRCLVPFTSFSEYRAAKPRMIPTWFAASADRPLMAFAGVWTPWKGVRGTKAAPVEGEHELFAFLTTDANAVVGAVHPKAMPVILQNADEASAWLSQPWEEAARLQRPLPDGALAIVAEGEKHDG